jgi:hypothetical protein
MRVIPVGTKIMLPGAPLPSPTITGVVTDETVLGWYWMVTSGSQAGTVYKGVWRDLPRAMFESPR